MSQTQDVKTFARERGAHLVGIASVERFAEGPVGHRPGDLLPGARSVVVVALRLFQSVLDHPEISRESALIPSDVLPDVQQHYYRRTHYETVNWGLQLIGHQVAYRLSEAGHDVMPTPVTYDAGDLSSRVPGYYAPFSHRHAAVAAGLGMFGRNGLVITPKYGPRVRFNSVITTAELEPDSVLDENPCRGEECDACRKAWPDCFGELYRFSMAGREFELPSFGGCKTGYPCGGGGCIRVCPVGAKNAVRA
jgi:epoxyqueuosine reductase QueG